MWYQDENCCLEDLYLNQQILSLNLYNSSSPTDTNDSYLLVRLCRLSTNLSATWYAAPCALHVAISWVCQLVYPHGAVTITRVKQLNPLLLLLRNIVVSAGCIHPARNKGSTHIAGEKCWMMTLLLMFCPLCWRPQWNPSSGLVRGNALNWRTYTTYLLNHTERNWKNTANPQWISTDNFHTDQASLRKPVISVCSTEICWSFRDPPDDLWLVISVISYEIPSESRNTYERTRGVAMDLQIYHIPVDPYHEHFPTYSATVISGQRLPCTTWRSCDATSAFSNWAPVFPMPFLLARSLNQLYARPHLIAQLGFRMMLL